MQEPLAPAFMTFTLHTLLPLNPLPLPLESQCQNNMGTLHFWWNGQLVQAWLVLSLQAFSTMHLDPSSAHDF